MDFYAFKIILSRTIISIKLYIWSEKNPLRNFNKFVRNINTIIARIIIGRKIRTRTKIHGKPDNKSRRASKKRVIIIKFLKWLFKFILEKLRELEEKTDKIIPYSF